eukprot:1226839-Rhodomonas_salina.1
MLLRPPQVLTYSAYHPFNPRLCCYAILTCAVCCYARAMRGAVMRWRMLLGAVCGTEVGYAATRSAVSVLVALSSIKVMLLRARYPLSGTEIGYASTQYINVLSGSLLGAQWVGSPCPPTRVLCAAQPTEIGYCLRARYAVCSTTIGYCLRARYAVCSTRIGYCLHARYAVCGPEIGDRGGRW